MLGNKNSRGLVLPALLGSLLLSSCAVGPDYRRPAVAVPAAFKEVADWKVAEPRDNVPRGKWWEVFGDAGLNALMDQVDISNQNLKLAEARYRQAQALTQTSRASDAQQQMLNDTVTAYAKSLELTKNRYAVGVAGRVDVVQAETQLKSAQASALDLGVQRAQLEHAIALLVGKAPSEFSLAVSDWNASIPKLPVALPATLLERRPDIAAAERRAPSANAQIGVAH